MIHYRDYFSHDVGWSGRQAGWVKTTVVPIVELHQIWLSFEMAGVCYLIFIYQIYKQWIKLEWIIFQNASFLLVDIQSYSLADEKKIKVKSNKEVMFYEIWQYFMFFYETCAFFSS